MSNDSDPSKENLLDPLNYQPHTSPITSPESTVIISDEDIPKQQPLEAQQVKQQLELSVISIKRSSTSDAKTTDNSVPDTPTSDVLPDRKRTRVNVESPLGSPPLTVAEPPLGARTPIASSLQGTIIPQTTDPIYTVPQTKSIITLTTPAIDSNDFNNDEMDDMLSVTIPEVSAQWMVTSKVSKLGKKSKNKSTKKLEKNAPTTTPYLQIPPPQFRRPSSRGSRSRSRSSTRMRFNPSNQPRASHIPRIENTRLSQESSKSTAYRYNPPPLMSIDPAYIPPFFVQQQIRKQFEESQKQKRERRRAVQPTLTPQATKSTNAITTVNSKPQSKPLPLPTTTADLIPVPTVAVLSDSMASRIRQDELQSPHATIKLYSQSGATIDKLIEYVYSNDGTQFLSDVRQVLLIVGTNDLSDKYPDDMIKSITMMYNNIRYRFPQIQKVFIHKIFPRKKTHQIIPLTLCR
ncbi:unnamed protein product [Didymodactylos carnosus]|uniref:Uncharacterized protein n=1 Tax=Didymodactylos carnosus TaxID=1234261 RepID=A0A8S2X9X6_9BILA|nr:unnamed protein product [Didymodactylos carnosus]